jgi:hypothetical protein
MLDDEQAKSRRDERSVLPSLSGLAFQNTTFPIDKSLGYFRSFERPQGSVPGGVQDKP